MDFELPAALLPLVLAGTALMVWALVDLTRSDVKWVPKWLWACIIFLSVPFGAIVYFLAGREGRSEPDADAGFHLPPEPPAGT